MHPGCRIVARSTPPTSVFVSVRYRTTQEHENIGSLLQQPVAAASSKSDPASTNTPPPVFVFLHPFFSRLFGLLKLDGFDHLGSIRLD